MQSFVVLATQIMIVVFFFDKGFGARKYRLMFYIIHNLAFATALITWIFVIHMVRSRILGKVPSCFLAAGFAVVGTQSFLVSYMLMFGRPDFYSVLMPLLALSFGPFLSMFAVSVGKASFRFEWSHLTHYLVPPTVVGLNLANPSILPLDIVIVLSFAVYALLLFMRLRRLKGHDASTTYSPVIVRWISVCVVLLSAGAISDGLIIIELASGTPVERSIALSCILVLHFILGAYVLFQSVQGRKTAVRKLLNLGSQLTAGAENIQAGRALADHFENYARTNALYLLESYTLKQAANDLRVTERQLSEAINMAFQENFSRRVNRMRVEHAQKMLRDQPDVSITEILYDSGFRTKSGFNKEFRALTGLSPSQYRKAG